MKRFCIGALSLLATAGLASPAFAGHIEPYPVTVDYIPFSVGVVPADVARRITFDVRSVEAVADGDWFGVDLNEDGEIAFIDSYIYVFAAGAARGSLGDLMGVNDDGNEAGFGDGSLDGFDSYLELDLFAGNYVLAISTHSMSEEEARAGVNMTDHGPYTLATNPAADWSNFDHGDYSIRAYDNFRGSTIFNESGTIFVIPAPAAGLILGLAGMVAGRRRR